MKLTLILCIAFTCGVVFAQEQTTDEKWEKNYREWQQLSPERKQQLRQRFAELKKMNPETREKFFENARRFRNLTSEQKERLRKKFEFLQSLPEDQRKTIRKFVRRYNQFPVRRRLWIKRRMMRLRMLPEAERELRLQRLPYWEKLSDSQRDAIRKFLAQ